MIKTVLIEDDDNARFHLKQLISQHCPEIELIGEANTLSKAVEIIDHTSPNLVFLDVELKDEISFTIFDQLKKPKTFEVIFTTGHSKYALQAIKQACLEYLIKPIKPIELLDSLAKFKEKRLLIDNQKQFELLVQNTTTNLDKSKRIAIPTNEGYSYTEVSEIVLCKAEANYTEIHFSNNNTMVSAKAINWFEEILPESLFFRCHKSYMINYNHVQKFSKTQGNKIILSNGLSVDVSMRKLADYFIWMHR